MTRRNARKHIFNLVFQSEFNKDLGIKDVLDTYNDEYEQLNKYETDFVSREYRGISANLEAIDSYIEKYSRGWSVARLAKTDLAILRIGVYEIMFDDDVPAGVAVNEAVELAKEFSDDKSYKFVNAILQNLI